MRACVPTGGDHGLHPRAHVLRQVSIRPPAPTCPIWACALGPETVSESFLSGGPELGT